MRPGISASALSKMRNLDPVPNNYNRCLDLAVGDYIKPFAQDDVLMADCLLATVAVLNENPHVTLVTTGRSWLDGQGSVVLKESSAFLPCRYIPWQTAYHLESDYIQQLYR